MVPQVLLLLHLTSQQVCSRPPPPATSGAPAPRTLHSAPSPPATAGSSNPRSTACSAPFIPCALVSRYTTLHRALDSRSCSSGVARAPLHMSVAVAACPPLQHCSINPGQWYQPSTEHIRPSQHQLLQPRLQWPHSPAGITAQCNVDRSQRPAAARCGHERTRSTQQRQHAVGLTLLQWQPSVASAVSRRRPRRSIRLRWRCGARLEVQGRQRLLMMSPADERCLSEGCYTTASPRAHAGRRPLRLQPAQISKPLTPTIPQVQRVGCRVTVASECIPGRSLHCARVWAHSA